MSTPSPEKPARVSTSDLRQPVARFVKRTSDAAKQISTTAAAPIKATAGKLAAFKREVAEDAAESGGLRAPLVEFKDVHVKFRNQEVLKGVDLTLYRGEFLSLVGPSGAGKSTLIRALTLEHQPESGSIIVAGRDITRLRDWEMPYYRRKIGIVFQDFKLLPNKTVWENVAFALEVADVPTRDVRRRVGVMLETVGMSHRKENFPHQLSGGEQQRVAIARALVHDPKILVADEPTGNLDPVNTWEIIELLHTINKTGTMVILATHDREVVNALKRRVVTLRDGEIVSDQEKGTYVV